MTLEEYEQYELAISKRKSEVDNDIMTIDERKLYMAMQCSKISGLKNLTHGFTSMFFYQPPHTPNPPLDKKDLSLEETLDDLFRIGAKNLRRMEQEVQHGCDEEKVRDIEQENGDILNFPIFPVTNVFASVCEHAEENINVNTTMEKEEVHVEDVKMDENHDVHHLNTNEELQWCMTKDHVLAFIEPNDHWQHKISSSISNEVKREFTITHRYEFLTSCILPVAYLLPYDVYYYPHLISSEGMNTLVLSK
ncbi:hypothetical protein Tco_1217818 [Tanacetum coccineum]